MPKAFRLGGRLYDQIFMDCLATEFRAESQFGNQELDDKYVWPVTEHEDD